MSADISSERLADFITSHSENDLRVLILFKLIKTRVVSTLPATNGRDMRRVDPRTLDEFCLYKAKKLAAIGKDPTEEDIRSFVASLVQ